MEYMVATVVEYTLISEKALKGLSFLHRRNQKCFSYRSDAENFAILGWSEYNYWASFLKK